MAGLHFDITGDNSNFMDKLRQTENGIRQTSKKIEQSGMGIEDMFGRMAKAAAGFGAAFSAQQFASQVMKVRGEFQQLEVAFETMLGSAEKASALMSQLTRTAAITPFGLQDVAGGAKQLLAYGVAANNVNDTLIRLGDIAAGLSIPLNDLVYLYGTTMTQGRMFTQDLRQFQGRGIPLADELAKQFGVTKDKVDELVTAGKVGFDEMHQAIVAMTSDGGKFGGLMEAQSKTITGKISNIEDAIDGMFNEIGKSSEGMINIALDGVSSLVENWEKVADAIGLAVASYGSYKAALMVTTAIDGVKTDIASTEEIAGLSELLGLKEEIKNADLEEAVAKGTLSQAKADYMAKLREEVQSRMTVLNLQKEEAEAEAQAALDAFNAAKQEKEAADERLENMYNLMEAAEAQGDASYTAYAQDQLQTASANANTAATRLNTAEKNLNAASSKAKAASTAADTFATNANTIANNANTKSLNLMKAAALQLQGILRSMYATLMANPLAIVIGAVGLLAYGIYSLKDAETAAEKATRERNEELEKQAKALEENIEKTEKLVRKAQDIAIADVERAESLAELRRMYPKIFEKYDLESIKLANILDLKKQITAEDARKRGEERTQSLESLNVEITKLEKQLSALKGQAGTGGLVAKLTDLRAKRDVLLKEVGKGVSEQFISSLDDVDMKGLDKYITVLENKIKGKGEDGKIKMKLPIDIEGNLSEETLYDVKDIKNLIDVVKARKESRIEADNAEKKSSADWLKELKKDYEKAEKALKDFQQSKKELSKEDWEKENEKLKTARDEAKKKYEEAGGSAKVDNKKKEQEEKANESLLSMRRENQQNEINLMKEGSAKRLAQINLDYQKEIDTIKEQERKLKEAQGGKLTKEQEDALAIAKENADKKKTQEISDVYRYEASTMRDFLKEYGTFQQQKLAIAEEYAEKIKNAQSEGEKLSLKKEMDVQIRGIEAQALKADIDWVALFGDVGTLVKDDMKKMLSDLEAYMKTDTFKSLDATDQEQIVESFRTLQEKIGYSFDGMDFKGLGSAVNVYREKQLQLNKVKEEEKKANEELIEAQKEFNEALKEGTNIEIEAAKTKLEDKTKKAVNAGKDVEDKEKETKDAGESVKTAAGKIKGALEDTANMLINFNSDSLEGAWEGFQNLSNLLQKQNGGKSLEDEALKWIGETIGGSVETAIAGPVGGEIASAALSLLDILRTGIENLISGLVDLVLGAVNGILDTILNFKIVQSVGKSLYEAIGSILDTLTFGGLSSWVKNSNAEEVNKTISRLTERNELLTDAIDNLRDTMEKARGSKSIEAYESAVDKQKEKQQNLLDIAKAQAGYHSAHHSWSYYFGDFTPEEVEWIQKNIDKDFTGKQEELWSFTPEQMKQLQTNVEIWERIKNTGKGGYGGRVEEKLQAYIDEAETLEELTSTLNEALTGITFESMYDSFISELMDMEKSAEEIADNISEYFMKAMLSNTIGEAMYDDLQNWYNKFAEAMKSDGLDETEIRNLRSEYEALVAEGVAQREAIAEATGYMPSEKYSQEASSKGFQEMSQETGEELNGRFTALQIAGEDIRNHMLSVVAYLSGFSSVITNGNDLLNDILQQHAITNAHLEDIVKNSKAIVSFGAKLDSIIENTKNL